MLTRSKFIYLEWLENGSFCPILYCNYWRFTIYTRSQYLLNYGIFGMFKLLLAKSRECVSITGNSCKYQDGGHHMMMAVVLYSIFDTNATDYQHLIDHILRLLVSEESYNLKISCYNISCGIRKTSVQISSEND